MFIKTLTAAAVLALSAATASADFACRAPEPSHEQIEDAKAFFTEWKATAESLIETGASLLPRATVNVKTYVHVVAASKSKYISQTQVNNQIKAMNEAYAAHGFQFTLAATDFTANSNWAQDGNEMAMKKALRKGTYSDLNLYFVETPADNALGYCYFPVSNASGQTLTQDGCTIMAQSVPGGTASPYNLGGTAIHEVGHWMNLFHTFQGGCSQGDQVDDTPAQASASSGCPTGRDSCPNNAGVDPIHNYMDYSDDACYEEFTKGQEARMHDAWTKYRS